MPRAMTREEREAFLAAPHVAVLSVSAGDDRGPLATPVWYSYEPGAEVTFMSGPQSRKAQRIDTTGRATLVVQSETAPYRYVTVEGPVTAGDRPDDGWRRALHHRYLGPELGDVVYEATRETLADEVQYRLVPERWTSSDYTEDFSPG